VMWYGEGIWVGGVGGGGEGEVEWGVGGVGGMIDSHNEALK